MTKRRRAGSGLMAQGSRNVRLNAGQPPVAEEAVLGSPRGNGGYDRRERRTGRDSPLAEARLAVAVLPTVLDAGDHLVDCRRQLAERVLSIPDVAQVAIVPFAEPLVRRNHRARVQVQRGPQQE